MRKLILQMQLTLDGFVGKPDGDVMWVRPAIGLPPGQVMGGTCGSETVTLFTVAAPS